jgi:hypothetical protein
MAEVEEFTDKNRNPKQSTERSQYPRQTIIKTAGGMTLLIGNEEGKEHLIISHPSGSHTEYHADGTVTSHTNAEAVNFVKGGMTLSIDENNDLKVTGHNKLQVSGGSHIEVAGDAGIVVAGDVMMGGMKNMAASFENLYLGARGNFNVNVEGDTKISTKGTTTFESQGEMKIASASPITQQATKIDLNPAGGSSGYTGGGGLTS